MGTMAHHSIVVTTFQVAAMKDAHDKAVELFGKLVSVPCPGVVNEQHSFFVAPDGSKEFWPESDDHDRRRALFLEHLGAMEARCLFVAWAEIVFGADEHGLRNTARVLNSSDRHDRESPANHPEIPESCSLCVKECTGACES